MTNRLAPYSSEHRIRRGDLIYVRYMRAMGDTVDGPHPTVVLHQPRAGQPFLGVPISSMADSHRALAQFAVRLGPADGVERPSVALVNCVQPIIAEQCVRQIGRIHGRAFQRICSTWLRWRKAGSPKQ